MDYSALSAAKKLLLGKRLRGASGPGLSVIPFNIARPERIPLSWAQRGLWFIDRLQGTSIEYNVSVATLLTGELDREALRNTLDAIVERHESLRTRFDEVDGEGVQVIVPGLRVDLAEDDLSGLENRFRQERVRRAFGQEWDHPFDLRSGPLFRMKLLKLGEQEHILLRTTHHIVCDAWSEAVFHKEFAILYNSYREGRSNPLQPLPLQYADFTVWQRKTLDEETLTRGLAYWKEQLAGIPESLDLAADRERRAVPNFSAGVCQMRLSVQHVAALKRVGREHDATVYMALLAAFGALLFRYTGQGDIVIGSPAANRPHPELEDLIGLFVNPLAMRLRITQGKTFAELLDQVRATALDAYRYRDIPFERIVEELSPKRNRNRAPVFQVVLAFQNTPSAIPEIPSLRSEPVAMEDVRVRYDLTIQAQELNDEIVLDWVYNRDLFDSWRIEQISRHFEAAIVSLTGEPHKPVGRMRLLDSAERARILGEWSAGETYTVPDLYLHEVFERQVRQAPDAPALVDSETRLSFYELNERCNRLAVYLRENGVRTDTVVAIYSRRNANMLISMLATLKAGGAYLPLDYDLPVERLAWILQDARPAIVLAEPELRDAVPLVGARILSAADLEERITNKGDSPPPLPRGQTDSAAYIIYTSGSTGRPKGVIVGHRQFVSYIGAVMRRSDFPLSARSCLFQPLSFDFSVTIVFASLCSRGCLHIVSEQCSVDAEALGAYLTKERIDCIKITPSHWAALQRACPTPSSLLPALRLIFGGEALPVKVIHAIEELAPECSVFNHYGPTETAVGVLVHSVSSEPGTESALVPLGRPLANNRVYVLDQYLEPVPVGVTGELHIGGSQVARGYLRQSGMTAQRFVADPYGPAGARMYRTGDRARWLADGTVEFMGRYDHQVKIRGFRVELEEIRSALIRDGGVLDAVIIPACDDEGQMRLTAYVVAAPERFDASAMRQKVAQSLPEYMVPGIIIPMPEWPLLANGKLDRRALMGMAAKPIRTHPVPQNGTEEILCGLFAEILGAPQVAVDQSFFEAGGHSLLAVSLVSKLRSLFGSDISLDQILDHPTPRTLAAQMGEAVSKRIPIGRIPRPTRIPMSYGQRRLWLVDRLQGSSCEYNVPKAVRLSGELDYKILRRVFDAITARHESLRTCFDEVDGETLQIIVPELYLPIPIEDLSHLPPDRRQERVLREIREEWAQPFDLVRGPVLRVRLLRLSEQEHVLLRTMHHIASDGWSQAVFNREFAMLYEAFHAGQRDPLAPLPVQYADFTLWQRELLDEEALRTGLAYWKRQLAGIPEILGLATDRPRPAIPTFNAAVCKVTLSSADVTRLKAVSRACESTVYMTLLAILAVLLGRYTGQDDIVIGSPIANRSEPELDHLIGFFVNSLAIRIPIAPDITFPELLAQVRKTALDAYRHQNIPFERIVEEVSPKRARNMPPIFQIVFAFQNLPEASHQLPGLGSETLPTEMKVRCDLEVYAVEQDGTIQLSWLYSEDLFDRWRIEQMCRHFVLTVEACCGDRF